MKDLFAPAIIVAIAVFAILLPLAVAAEIPNIVLIYCDDVGYGDLGCYGAETIPTPNIDRLASEGLRFTSGYASSASCTPSRYSLLTGEYAWRHPNTGIAPPNATALIEPGRVTLPSILKQAGYATGIVGKWHLGLGSPPKPDWSGILKPGPLEIGFDSSFILPTTNDRVPCVYVEGHRVVNLDPQDPVDVFTENPDGQPTGVTHRHTLKMDWSHGHNFSIVNGIGRIGFMTGGHAARWVDEEMGDVLVDKAQEFIVQHRGEPFFLFFSAPHIHVPRTPNERLVGATPHGPRGDAVVEFDWCVGELVNTLQELGLAENTLIIVTSDNGPVLDDGYKDDAVEKLGDHRPAGPFRGGKYRIYEGGTRMPWIVHWPGRIKPGVSDAIVSQVDLPRSLAALIGQLEALPTEAVPDSENVLPALLGETSQGRDEVVVHAKVLALRQDPWKLIEPAPQNKAADNAAAENDAPYRLYHLADDPGETRDVAAQQPDVVRRLADRLHEIRRAGQ